MASGQLGQVRELWRYPVMGMQGERVEEANVLEEGIQGDRAYVVYNEEAGNVLDPKKYQHAWGETLALPRMLEFKASYVPSHQDPSGLEEVEIETPDGMGISTLDLSCDELLGDAMGLGVKLARYPAIANSRVKSGRALHLLTGSSLASMNELYPEGDFDVRRFRPNILIDAPHVGFPEEEWLGSRIGIGRDVRLKVEKPNKRCATTTMKQGSVRVDSKILEIISRKHGNILGVMCSVVRGGVVQVGDAVRALG